MSTEHLPPDYYELPPEPRRQRNWKRRVTGILVGLQIVTLGLLVGTVALLHNHSFRQQVLRAALEEIKAVMGTRVQIGDFTLHLSLRGPALELVDVTVAGAAPYTTPPLLRADRISIGLQIVSLLNRSWYFRDVQIEHPVVRIVVDPQGVSNLPKSQSQTSIFDLDIRSLKVDRGEVYYNDRQSALNGDVRDFQFQSTFDSNLKQYSGRMNYRDGRIQIQDFSPIAHDLQTEFEATPAGMNLKNAVLTSGPSKLELTAKLDDYVHPQVTATYNASIDSGQFREITRSSSLPTGLIQTTGSLQYHSEPNRALLDSLSVDGNLTSATVQLSTPDIQTAVREISARYILANGNLDVSNLRARILGGELTGAMKMQGVSSVMQSELRVNVKGVQLANVQSLVKSPSRRPVTLGGIANAVIDASWSKALDNLKLNTDATVHATVSPVTKTEASSRAVQLDGEIHAQYVAVRNQISFTRTTLRTQQTSVNLNGAVATNSSLQVQLQSNDLSEIEMIADAFHPVGPMGLRGKASFVGTVRGSTVNPQIAGQLAAAPLSVRGTDWRTLRTNLTLSPSMGSLQNGVLQPLTRGRLTFDVGAALANWSFTNTSPIQASVTASQLNVTDLQKIAGVTWPVSGDLSANISAHGSLTNPVGQGSISIEQAEISGEPVQTLNVSFQGTGDNVHATLNLRLPAGSAQGDFNVFPKQQAYEARFETTGFQLNQLQSLKQHNLQMTGVLNLKADGKGSIQNLQQGTFTAELDVAGIRLEEMQALKARNIQAGGVLSVKASGTGTIDNPQVELLAQIPQLQIQNQTVNGLKLQANIANQVANLVLDSATLNTQLHGTGKVNLTGDYETDAKLDTSAIPLQPLIAAYAPSLGTNFTGTTEVHATVRGPLKNPSMLDAHATIPTLALNYKNTIQVGAVNPIQVDYASGVLTIQRTTIRGTGTDLQLQGTIPTNSSAPVSLLAVGTMDLRLAQLLDPEVTSSGQVRFDVNSYGGGTSSGVHGKIEIVNASFATADLPLGLQNGNGTLLLRDDRVDIQQFRGTMGGGAVSAQGGVVYRPSIQYNLALAADGLRLLYPDGVRSVVGLNVAMTGSAEAASVRGQVRLDQPAFTPNFDFESLIGAFAGGAPTSPTSFANKVQLDVTVQSTNDLNLVGQKLSLEGTADLRVRGTAAQPVITGRVNLTGGDLIYRGSRYLIQESTVDFVNPLETQPILNVAADTTIQAYDIHLRIRGPIDHLLTTYTSDPALPAADVINLLVFGKTKEAEAANPTPGNLGAESLVASTVSGAVSSRLEKVTGLSRLSIDPVLGGNQQNPGANITVQQRVSGNLFVTFATDTSAQRQAIKLEYQVTPSVSMSGVRDQNGGFAVDVRVRKTW